MANFLLSLWLKNISWRVANWSQIYLMKAPRSINKASRNSFVYSKYIVKCFPRYLPYIFFRNLIHSQKLKQITLFTHFFINQIWIKINIGQKQTNYVLTKFWLSVWFFFAPVMQNILFCEKNKAKKDLNKCFRK